MSDQEHRTEAVIGMIVRNELTIDQLRRAITQTRESNPTEEETLGAIAAAEEALETIEALSSAEWSGGDR